MNRSYEPLALCMRVVSSVVVVLAIICAPAVASEKAVSNRYFGLHIFYAGAYTAWPQVAFGSWRLHDAVGTTWDYLQPERARWDFEKLDGYVALAERNGVDLVLTLGITPQWASARPDEASGKGPGRAAEPRDLADWERYVSTVVKRYAGRIKYYEIWNEPRFTEVQPWRGAGFYSGSAKTMVELARVAYTTVKRLDPGAMVISPSMDGEDLGVRKLELYFSLGGARYTDVVGFHFYLQSTREPEGIGPLTAKLRATMNKFGLGSAELWNTESGYVIRESGKNAKAMDTRGMLSVVIDESLAAAWLAQSMLLGMDAGLQRFYWFAWDSSSMGLLGVDRPRRPNAAGVALRTLIAWTVGREFQGCRARDDAATVCTFLDAGGRATYVVWAPIPAQFVIPDGWDVNGVETLSGDKTRWTLEARKIDIGPAPILLR